jgi:FtsZ-binding cell division protein ZapB
MLETLIIITVLALLTYKLWLLFSFITIEIKPKGNTMNIFETIRLQSTVEKLKEELEQRKKLLADLNEKYTALQKENRRLAQENQELTEKVKGL